jgi:uncharacterized protein
MDAAVTALEDFISADRFPCVGAKAAHCSGGLTTVVAGDFLSARDDAAVVAAFRSSRPGIETSHLALSSFAVIYLAPCHLDEREFEAALWARLAGLAAADTAGWATGYCRDPTAANFAMSLAGTACHVIGLHPQASRPGRRFEHCALIFNAHDQFASMRANGRFGRMQAVNRSRDLAFHGSINPMLQDFGSGSEARQYSGRAVGPGWRCPGGGVFAGD